MAILILAALFLLPGHPARPYVRIFFIGGVLCICAEGLTGSLLGVYQAKAGLMGDPDRDVMLAGLLVSALIHPLMAVIYARLAPGRPLVLAAAVAISLGLLEVYFVRSGYLTYRKWHPAGSALFYFWFLTAVWLVHSHRWAVSIWMHTLGMAFWLVSSTTYLLHGVLGLWQFPVTAQGSATLGSHLAAMLYGTALVIPVATLSSGILQTNWPLTAQVAAGVLVLVGADTLMQATGGVTFVQWNLWLSVLRYAAELGAVALYVRWLRAGVRTV